MNRLYVRIYIVCITLILLLLMSYTIVRTSKQDKQIDLLEQKIKSLEKERFKGIDYEFNTK